MYVVLVCMWCLCVRMCRDACCAYVSVGSRSYGLVSIGSRV